MEMSWYIRLLHITKNKELYHNKRKFPSWYTKDMPIHFCTHASKASLTVEAAFIFPIFFFVCISFLILIKCYFIFGIVQGELNKKAVYASIRVFLEEREKDETAENKYKAAEDKYKAVKDKDEIVEDKGEATGKQGEIAEEEEKYIKEECERECRLFLQWMGIRGFSWRQKSITYPYTGKTVVPADTIEAGGAEVVYVTPDGTVYHTSRGCSYLNPSIQPIDRDALSRQRNRSGGIYYPCERCMGNTFSGREFYITCYGDRYHSSKSCSGLKRTIIEIPLSALEGRRGCAKCAS